MEITINYSMPLHINFTNMTLDSYISFISLLKAVPPADSIPTLGVGDLSGPSEAQEGIVRLLTLYGFTAN